MKIMATKIAAAALALTLAVPSTAALAYSQDNRGYHDDRDRRGDHRSDRGGITKRDAVNQVLRSFDRIDRNRNDKISKKEIRRFERYADRRHGYRYARYDPYRYDNNRLLITTENFRKFDRNHDGIIRRHEAKRAIQRRFERADRNNNGRLSEREIRRAGWYDFDYDYDWERGHHDRWDYEHERERGRRR